MKRNKLQSHTVTILNKDAWEFTVSQGRTGEYAIEYAIPLGTARLYKMRGDGAGHSDMNKGDVMHVSTCESCGNVIWASDEGVTVCKPCEYKASQKLDSDYASWDGDPGLW